MAKLGVKNTAAIVMYAVKTNLVSPNKFLFAGEANQFGNSNNKFYLVKV